MIIAICFFIASCALFLGFYAGENFNYKKRKPTRKQQAEIIKLKQEFENFLNYDGSQQ